MVQWRNNQRGDTLIEVTFALAILGFVLLSSTAIAAAAFRTGQTARERTAVSTVAQEQMEALRSFRDNHTWAEFQSGLPGKYLGVNNAATGLCSSGPSQCFHMVLGPTTAGTTEWTPQPGQLTPASPGSTLQVPTSSLELSSATPAADQGCGYDFLLTYQFSPLGGGTTAVNRITTRLANLKFNGVGTCP